MNRKNGYISSARGEKLCLFLFGIQVPSLGLKSGLSTGGEDFFERKKGANTFFEKREGAKTFIATKFKKSIFHISVFKKKF